MLYMLYKYEFPKFGYVSVTKNVTTRKMMCAVTGDENTKIEIKNHRTGGMR